MKLGAALGNSFEMLEGRRGRLAVKWPERRASSSGGPMTIGLRGHRIMPSFRRMPVEQRLEVLEYVKSLNRGFWERNEFKTVTVPTPPALTPERLTRGKQLYADAECLACHGERGRGDGPQG